MKIWWTAFFFMVGFIPSLASGAADPRLGVLVDKIILLERVEHELAQLPEILNTLTSTHMPPSDNPMVMKRKSDVLKSSFDPAAAMKEVKDYLLAHGDVTTFEKVVTWLESPLGKKISAVEAESGTFESQANELLFFSKLDATPPTDARFAKIRAIVTASGEVEMYFRFIDGLARKLPGGGIAGEARAKFQENIEKSRPMLEDEFMQESFRTSLYTYRSISDDDLDDYLYFLKSKECRSFINLMIESTGKALDSYVGRYMKAMEDYVNEQKNMPQKQQPE